MSAVFHSALEPPCSAEEVSATSTCLPGASRLSADRPSPKSSDGEIQVLQAAEVPQLYPSSATASTKAAPGYRPSSGVDPKYGTLGFHTQVMLEAPVAATVSWTWRHAAA